MLKYSIQFLRQCVTLLYDVALIDSSDCRLCGLAEAGENIGCLSFRVRTGAIGESGVKWMGPSECDRHWKIYLELKVWV